MVEAVLGGVLSAAGDTIGKEGLPVVAVKIGVKLYDGVAVLGTLERAAALMGGEV